MAKKIIIPAKKSTITSKIPKITTKKPSFKKKALTKFELEEALLNNFVNLQKVLTNLSVKFEELSDNITKLLQLFEISAKSFTEKYPEGVKEEAKPLAKEDKQLLSKLDSLLDQNKTIARGIMLMEEKIRQRTSPRSYPNREEDSDRFHEMLRSKPLPRY